MAKKIGSDERVPLPMEIRARKIDLGAALGIPTEEEQRGDAPADPLEGAKERVAKATQLDMHGAWLEISLDDQQIGLEISINDVVKEVEEIGLKVYKCSQVSAKVFDEEAGTMAPLGDKITTHRYNLTVKPEEGSALHFNFGRFPMIPLTKYYRVEGRTQLVKYEGYLTYAIGGKSFHDTKLSAETNKYVSKICGSKYGCKQLTFICNGSCAMRAKKRAEDRKRMREFEGRVPPPPMARDPEVRRAANQRHRAREKEKKKEAYEQRVRRGKSLIAAPSGVTKCTHLVIEGKGKCWRGKFCSFDHSWYGSADEISKVECGLPRRERSQMCVLGMSCIYSCAPMLAKECVAPPSPSRHD